MEEQQMPLSTTPPQWNAGYTGERKKSKPFRKFLWGLVITAVLVIIVWILFGSVFWFSKGYREGYVYKFSEKGTIFKTWEGTLKTGFISFNNTSTPNEEWKFSVKDNAVADQLNKLGERVILKLYYTQYYTRLFWKGDTKYFITKVEVTGQH
jgi:hypothetical protein